MGKLLGLLGGWQGYAAAAGLSALLSIAATYYITSMSYKVTISGMERDTANQSAADAMASLKQFQANVDKMTAAAGAFTNLQFVLDAQFGKISKDFNNAIKAKPLPADCVPDAGRLHSLVQAVAAANAAAAGQLGPAVPATP